MSNIDGYTLIGALSAKTIKLPNVNKPPMPAIAASGMNFNGAKIEQIDGLGISGYPDVRSHRRKFGLLLPATNTSMEHELWTVHLNLPKPTHMQI